MSKCTIRNIQFLKQLSKSKKLQREKLINNATKDNLHCLTEIAFNTLKGNIHYDGKVHKKLQRFRSDIRKLAKKSLPLKHKKKILIQRGGFVPALLAPIISAVVSGLLSKAISKYV